MLPPWLQLLIAVLTPMEAAALAMIMFFVKEGRADRKAILEQLRQLNGQVRDHGNWIISHDRATADYRDDTRRHLDRLSTKIDRVEERA